MRRYRRIRRADFVAAVVGTLGVVLFGPLAGLGIAIAVSLLTIIYRSSFPRIEVLGKISSEKAAWGRLRGFPDRRPVVGVVVVRLDAPLFWANATAIEERLLAELERWPSTVALVLDLEATTQLDTTSVDVLAHLVVELRQRGVELYLARVLHPANAVLVRSGFFELLGEERCWHSISQCVHGGAEARRAEGPELGAGRRNRFDARMARPTWVRSVSPWASTGWTRSSKLERDSVEVEGGDDGPAGNGAGQPST